MKKIILIFSCILLFSSCSSDEEGSSTNNGNINTLLREATITNDNEGTRFYTYDTEYKLTQIKNDVKTITFSYYPPDDIQVSKLKSIIWKKGNETRKLELTYVADDLQGIDTMTITKDGESIIVTNSIYPENSNYIKLDFGSYYELVLGQFSEVQEIKKYNTETNELVKNQSYRFGYFNSNVDIIEYGYGRVSNRMWMLYYIDKEEFFKFPLLDSPIDYIQNYEESQNFFFQQHSHEHKNEVLTKTKIHFQDDVFFEIEYKFDKLPGKVD